MSDLEKRFGRRLKQIRTSRGLTQAGLGDLAGFSEEWVRKIERGEGGPRFGAIEKLSSALGVDVSALFLPDDPTVGDRIAAASANLSPAEVDWVTGLIEQVARRPKG